MPSPRVIAAVLAVVLAFASGWWVRGLVATNDMSEFKDDLRAKQEDQRALKAKVEAADAINTRESTARIDEAQAEQQKEIQYVNREVIRYVAASPAGGRCALPADWVRLYNETAGVSSGVPATGATRPQAYAAGGRTARNSVPGR